VATLIPSLFCFHPLGTLAALVVPCARLAAGARLEVSMATRKRSNKASQQDGNAFVRVVEGLRADFRELLTRFVGVEDRLNGVEGGLITLRDDVNRRFDGIEMDIGRLQSAVLAQGHQLREIRTVVDRKADRNEVPVR
jgi:hypothetical protein